MSPKATSFTLKKNCTKNCWFMTSCMSSCNWIYCFLNLWNMFVFSWRIWLCRWTKRSGLVPSWYLIPGKLKDCLGFEQRTGLSIEYSATDVLNIHRCIFPSHGHTGLAKLSNLIGLWYGLPPKYDQGGTQESNSGPSTSMMVQFKLRNINSLFFSKFIPLK